MKTRKRTRCECECEGITDNGLVSLSVCVCVCTCTYVCVQEYSLSDGHVDVPVQCGRYWHGLCLMPKQSTKLPRCPLLQMRGERNLIGLSARDELLAWSGGRKATANCQLLCTRVLRTRCHAVRLLADYARNARPARHGCIQREHKALLLFFVARANIGEFAHNWSCSCTSAR